MARSGLSTRTRLLALALPPLVPDAATSPVNFKKAQKEATTGQQGQLL